MHLHVHVHVLLVHTCTYIRCSYCSTYTHYDIVYNIYIDCQYNFRMGLEPPVLVLYILYKIHVHVHTVCILVLTCILVTMLVDYNTYMYIPCIIHVHLHTCSTFTYIQFIL